MQTAFRIPKAIAAPVAIIALSAHASFAQGGDGYLPDFVNLSQVHAAIVGRICLNQILEKSPEQQQSMSPKMEEDAKNCMVSYREIFSRDQLQLVHSIIRNAE